MSEKQEDPKKRFTVIEGGNPDGSLGNQFDDPIEIEFLGSRIRDTGKEIRHLEDVLRYAIGELRRAGLNDEAEEVELRWQNP